MKGKRMKQKELICLLIAGLLVCARVTAQDADAALRTFFKDYLEAHFRLCPAEATRLGDHRFDGQLEDVSAAARQSWLTQTRKTLAELPKRVDYAKLSRDGQVDYNIFKQELTRNLWLTENTRPFEEDPRAYGDYINDSVYLLLTQSTLPKETNIANCIARMRQIPRVVATAKATLTHPPKPILETSIL
jgi:uncharacterized protein (DUF885 family)